MYDGWIKLYRRIYDNPVVWRSSEAFDHRSAWIDLLMLVNHADTDIMINFQIISVKRGQTWTSYRRLAERWHWSIGKVRRYTDCLVRAQMITLNAHPDGTLLTVVNYEVYQGERHTDAHTDGTQTEHRQTHGQTTNKNTMNDNNDNNVYEQEFESLWSLYPRKKGNKKTALASYIQSRQSGVSYETVKSGLVQLIEYLDREKPDPQFIPYGETWFCNERWTDEYDLDDEDTDQLKGIEL